jgi:DNA-directed RNA polymerase II subunit RPB1
MNYLKSDTVFKKEYGKVLNKIIQVGIMSNYENSEHPIIHIRFSANNYNSTTFMKFYEMIVEKYRVKGIIGITDSIVEQESYNVFMDDGSIGQKERYNILTLGINMKDIIHFNGIDLSKTVCNDIVLTTETQGIEAGRMLALKEFNAVLDSSSTSANHHHVSLLIDSMTSTGTLTPVNRHGTSKLETGPLSKASFEQTTDKLVSAAVFGESDHVRSTSAKIMFGAPINGGTGAFRVLFDHECLKSYVDDSAKKTTKKKIISTAADFLD